MSARGYRKEHIIGVGLIGRAFAPLIAVPLKLI